ncbi:hypothetical protein H4R18_002504 [Coemansia javaensis]|uniref:Uncharacterized protein n=1 Tax=Coemansia javaensis TaxID=2761396 RepID=A0A9W8HGI0_9FUNG|nr:hypothetical protein H4R18_002504 [Coemansia javaensis]
MTAAADSPLRLLRGESAFRAYIGFLWFFARPPLAPAEAAAAVQRGVDAVAEQTPALAGVLREDAQGLCVDYAAPAPVRVEQRAVGRTLAELAAASFDQARFPDVFAAVPGVTAAVDGLPVLLVQTVALSCGALCVVVACHHSVADGAATAMVARRISDAIAASPPPPEPMWCDRRAIVQELEQHEPVLLQCFTDINRDARARRGSVQNLAVSGRLHMGQIRFARAALDALRALPGAAGCSTNSLVMAALWRAWARVLVAHGSQGTVSYSGGPVDMRSRFAQPAAQHYLGNLIQPLPMAAPLDEVLHGTLPALAALVRQRFQDASLAGMRAQMAATLEGDVFIDLAATDTPVLAITNITNLALTDTTFGLGARPVAVHLRTLDAPYIVFAISDGGGGILANTVLPQSLFDGLGADPELSQYAQIV